MRHLYHQDSGYVIIKHPKMIECKLISLPHVGTIGADKSARARVYTRARVL